LAAVAQASLVLTPIRGFSTAQFEATCPSFSGGPSIKICRSLFIEGRAGHPGEGEGDGARDVL